MKSAICPYCGAQMKRNGKTKTGAQRWRCKDCGGSKTHRINNDAKQLDAFLDWLFSSEKQMDMPGQGRTFRRMASKFWKLWPLPRFIDEIHRVIFVDGIYIARNLVILIACSEEHVLSWHLGKKRELSFLVSSAIKDRSSRDGGKRWRQRFCQGGEERMA